MTLLIAKFDLRRFLGALLLSFAFGSLHAFGVLIEPLQTLLEAERASVSFVYSLAIISLTFGVFVSARITPRFTPTQIAAFCGLIGSAGLALVALWPTLGTLLLGYGVLFGFSNGLAYSLFLEQAANALPQSKGLSLGMATAMYGVGAAAFTQILAPFALPATIETAIALLALSLILSGGIASVMFSRSRMNADLAYSDRPMLRHRTKGIFRLWIIYCLAASGGLMVIVHSVGIVRSFGASELSVLLAPTVNAVGNIFGSLIGGIIGDRLSARKAIAVPLLISLASLLVMLVSKSDVLLLLVMTACGFGYGALIAVIPIAVRKIYEPTEIYLVFGRVFTAWGFAGLAGPYVAGRIFDKTSSYSFALTTAVCCLGFALLFNLKEITKNPKSNKDF